MHLRDHQRSRAVLSGARVRSVACVGEGAGVYKARSDEGFDKSPANPEQDTVRLLV